MTTDECKLYLSSNEERFGKSRLLVVPELQDRLSLRNFYHTSPKASLVKVSQVIASNEFVPMPDLVISRTVEAIHSVNLAGQVALVVGIGGYLALLDSSKLHEAYVALKDILDNESVKAIIMLDYLDLTTRDTPWSHPRYREDNSIIFVGGCGAETADFCNVIFALKEYPTPGYFRASSIRDYLCKVEDEPSEINSVCVSLDSCYDSVPGVNASIRQFFDLKCYMRQFWNFEDDAVSEEALRWILSLLRKDDTKGSVLSTVQQHFYPNGIQNDILIQAPAKLRLMSGASQEALAWMLRKTLSPDTYLYKVLTHKNLLLKDFTFCYVSKAQDLLGDGPSAKLAEERKKALKEIGYENISRFLLSFIEQAKDRPTDQIAVWLNNGVGIEKHELLRRIVENQGCEIPREIRESYPQLDDYLGEYQLGFVNLNDYFSRYRTQKLKDCVSEEFCERAFRECELDDDLVSREEIIRPYTTDTNTALIVVDALGVEYIPMIVSIANRREIGVEKWAVGYSRLPTSTEFNEIDWIDTHRRLPDVKQIDNIIHSGAEGHTRNSPQENIAAAFDAIEKNVFSAIEEGLLQFDRIVLTSDHGASRLAICAHNQSLDATIELPEGAEVMDWRYSKAAPNQQIPGTMKASYCGDYWAVRGYNRLPRQGGKDNELHGGATVEERLVPVMVFKMGAVFTPAHQSFKPGAGVQIIENDDFDL